MDVELDVLSASISWMTLKAHGFLREEAASHCRHNEQIANSCPQQQWALHQWHNCTLSQ